MSKGADIGKLAVKQSSLRQFRFQIGGNWPELWRKHD
jgi:hypothetical protein